MSRDQRSDSKSKNKTNKKSFQQEISVMIEERIRQNSAKRLKKIQESANNQEKELFFMIYGKSALFIPIAYRGKDYGLSLLRRNIISHERHELKNHVSGKAFIVVNA
jgi:hypothetical protein